MSTPCRRSHQAIRRELEETAVVCTANNPATHQEIRNPCLPEAQEDDGFDEHKLHERVKRRKQLVRAEVEQQQRVESERVCEIIHEGYPEIPAALRNACRTDLRHLLTIREELDFVDETASFQTVRTPGLGSNSLRLDGQWRTGRPSLRRGLA